MKQETIMTGSKRRHWHRVDIADEFDDFSDPNLQKKLEWLNEYEGVGMFFFDSMFNEVYFECNEDQTMFLLRWVE